MSYYFIIGLNKTGTSSIRDALELSLHLPHSHPIIEKMYRENKIGFNERNIQNIFSYTDSLIKDYNLSVFKDRPWNNGVYKELNEKYSNSKFILTIRDEEEWWASVQNWLSLKAVWGKNLNEKLKIRRLDLKTREYNAHFNSTTLNKENYIKYYNSYNNAVREYFKDKPNFRVLEINKNFDWINIQNLVNLNEETMRDNIIKTKNQRGWKNYHNIDLDKKIKDWKFLTSNINILT
jgi:hypothetical protein